jgi:hypothetical protein
VFSVAKELKDACGALGLVRHAPLQPLPAWVPAFAGMSGPEGKWSGQNQRFSLNQTSGMTALATIANRPHW